MKPAIAYLSSVFVLVGLVSTTAAQNSRRWEQQCFNMETSKIVKSPAIKDIDKNVYNDKGWNSFIKQQGASGYELVSVIYNGSEIIAVCVKKEIK